MLNSYRTFLKSGKSEIIEKKSRFIGSASFVDSEDKANEFINSVRKSNNGANHNVFAYRIEGPTVLERQSDDGEPSNTAGLPLLDVLRGERILNGVIVVTRYFGGTLLGTGGLVRAYGKAAKECALDAVIVDKNLYACISISVDYSLSGKVEYEVLKFGAVIADTVYTENVEFKVYIITCESDKFIKDMTNLTGGKGGIILNEPVYAAVVDGEFILM
ncbi:MAG: YigZ family protein [Clostridiales bacterium]|nr:YigZ family protein [Clostridiales bacterium]